MPALELLNLQGVWKRHRRWKRKPQSLKEALIRAATGRRSEYEDFWALRDVDLSLQRGESLGVCGSNGAGKSTLLKVIAGILPPSHGRVTVRGRLATLLELGAGFLPDLTGRENILLNGAILGLSEREMRRKLDAIVEFADLGDFMDSPVRVYSTGMYMRLGFAVASHVDAEILLLDEVLAVGDAAFQQKCVTWLEQLKSRNTTVLIVSHDQEALQQICDRVVWLDRGAVRADAGPAEILQRYEASQQQAASAESTQSPEFAERPA